MAVVVTLLGTATFTTASGTKTVVATPAVGDLIVIVTSHSGNTSAATPTDNNGSGTYTKINSAVAQSSVDTLGIHIRTALIGAATSTTFSHAPGTSTGGGLAVFKVTGMSKVGAAAALQSAIQNNQASGGTPTPVLGAAAKIFNALIGAVMNATSPATLTPRASWTELCDVGYSTPTTGLETMSRNSGETGTSIAWGGTSPSAFASLVLELDTTVVAALGLSLETDEAFALAAVNVGTTGLGTETETALALPAVQARLVGLSTSVGTSLGLRATQIQSVGISTETETSLGLTSPIGVSASLETDTALALTGKQVRATGLSIETNTALTLGRAVGVGLSVETDAALGLAAVQLKPAGISLEAETVPGLAGLSVRAVGLSSTSDASIALVSGQGGPVGQCLEVDTALGLLAKQSGQVGVANENDQAFPLGSARPVGLASETQTAFALAPSLAATPGISAEQDSAFELLPMVSGLVGLALEDNMAFALRSPSAATTVPPERVIGPVPGRLYKDGRVLVGERASRLRCISGRGSLLSDRGRVS